MTIAVLNRGNIGLYFALMISAAFLFIAALGPGLYSSQPIFFSWQYILFDMLCHQDPARSFYLSNNMMAVCSRCFGFYAAFFMGWFLIPVARYINKKMHNAEKILFTTAILINLGDVIGNALGFWINTLNSRFILGSYLGLTTALFLLTEFKTSIKSEDR